MPRTLVTTEMRQKSKAQRKFATKGETLLWYELRDLKSEGLKFRRQSPIGPYVADFVCFEPKIVVEVDGDSHEAEGGKRHDLNRDGYLRGSGFLVLRYDAGDALSHAWHIAQDVKDKAGALPRLPHPRPSAGPSPQGGGERRHVLSPLAGEMSPQATEGVSSDGTAITSCAAEVTPPGSLREPPSPRGGGRAPITSASRLAHRTAGDTRADRAVPEETPIALSYGGTTHAVMMATPADLDDFALGFSLTEGIISAPDEIEAIDIEEAGAGIDIQIRLKDKANTRFEARRRRLAGPVGCGLCGIESIDEAMRSVASVAREAVALSPRDIVSAVQMLSKQQPLHRETGAVHAAGFYVTGKGVIAAREDVGRHNALDKLAGALARSGVSGSAGAVVVTSRVSVEMVQKTAAIGASFIIAVSAPTALAVRTANHAGMTLVALVRGDEYDVFTHPDRLIDGEKRYVA